MDLASAWLPSTDDANPRSYFYFPGLLFYHAPMPKHPHTTDDSRLKGQVPPEVPLGPGDESPPTTPCPICLDAGFLRFDVPFDDPRFGQLLPCSCTEQRRLNRRRELLIDESNLRPLRDCTFNDFNPHTPELLIILQQARAYARQSNEGWMILSGPPGSGKTHLAAAIGHTFLERDKPVIFTLAPDLLDKLQAMSGDDRLAKHYEYLRKIQSIQLLILDALGLEQQSPWGNDKIVQILSYRSQRMLPTVVTLNNLLSSYPPHLRSLLSDTLFCSHLHIEAPDFRQLSLAQRFRRHPR